MQPLGQTVGMRGSIQSKETKQIKKTNAPFHGLQLVMKRLEPSKTSGLPGSSAGGGWEGSGRPAQPAPVSMEVLIKWKEVIIKFTAVPQSTTVCVLLITYTGPRQRKWQPRQ